MSGSYDAEQRKALEQRLRAGDPLECPVCGGVLSVQPVPPPASVSYVRHRAWVLCTACRRTASVDVEPGRA